MAQKTSFCAILTRKLKKFSLQADPASKFAYEADQKINIPYL